MKPHFLLPALAVCAFSALTAGAIWAQTLGDALDSPSFAWTAAGAVTPLNDPALSHDGVDVVRLDATTNASTGGPWPSVRTTVTVPSVVEFWHRSLDLAAMTTLGRNQQPVAISSSWKKVRWVQWPVTPTTPGELEIGNQGELGSGPLFVDDLSISPAVQVSLAEALDFPGFIGSGDSVAGLAESWLAPDGVDAVVFGGFGMEATLPGPGLIRFRHGGGDGEPSVTVAFDGSLLPAFVLGDTTWAWVNSGGNYLFSPNFPTEQPSLMSQDPIVMDALEYPAVVPINEALDAPALTFSVSGMVAGTEAPPGAPDGDAVLCLRSNVWSGADDEISLTVSGPGIVRFTYLGTVSVQRTGQTGSEGGTATTWKTMDIPVYRKGETVTWRSVVGDGCWLTAVSVLPPTAEKSIAGLLNAPDLIPELLVPAYVGATDGQVAGDSAVEVTPLTPVLLEPVLRLPFSGASFLSLDVTSYSRDGQLRIDGGAWQVINFFSNAPFRAIVPGDGPHALEVTGPVTLDHFHVIPLIAVPLSEALDAPDLTFTTSPEWPWSGYSVPAGSGWSGNHAAFGGSHSTPADPWIETQVTGPGILRSSTDLHTVGLEVGVMALPYPQLLIDGIPPQGYFSHSEILLPSGVHTARWVQHGSQIQTAYGTLSSLDAVSFEPLIPISIGTALDTPDREWTVGGLGTLTPVVWAVQSPDEEDSVHFESQTTVSNPWVETEVNLPCTVSFRGKYMRVSIGDGPGLFQLPVLNPSVSDPNGFSSIRKSIPGHGPARVRFTATQPQAVLDMVDFEEPDGRLLPAVTVGTTALTWKLYGDQPWQVVPNEATGIDRYRAGLDAAVWMETVVTGPGKLFVTSATLPDHDNRQTDSGWIPYAGLQRVLVNRAANSLLYTTTFQPSAPIAAWIGSPDLNWTTGGDVPWQSTFEGSVRSGLVWPGEISWIEAILTGPGVLYWDYTVTGSGVQKPEVSCDGMAVANSASRGWLHVGAGAHRIRWAMANPNDGNPKATNVLTLKNVAFTPQPVESVSSVLSAGALSFYEIPPVSSDPDPTTPLPWPSPSGWRIVNDATLPGPAVRGENNSGTLAAFLPARGRIASLLKMDGSIPPGTTIPAGGLVAAAAPFPWLPWSSSARFPQGEGVQTFVAQSVFVPDSPVSVAEALDHADLIWTAGSTPAGLWEPRATSDSSLADQDALYLGPASLIDRAWLETTVTGPLRVTTNFDRVGTGGDADCRIFVDDVLFLADLISRIPSSSVKVPPGNHRLRWEIAPSQTITAVSNIAIRSITTAATIIPDVPTLVDATELEWASAGTSKMTAATTGAHDGVDALVLNGNRLVVGLTGPGAFSFWIKSPRFTNGIILDSVPVPRTQSSASNWVQYTLPIPHGRHSVSLFGDSVDEFLFQPLAEVSAEAALDAPAGVTVSLLNPEMVGAAAFPGLSDDGTDSLLLMPGNSNRIALHVPPLSSLSLRVRAAFGAGTFGIQDLASMPTTTTWTTRNFSTTIDGGLTTVYLRASTVPVLLDSLIVTTPPATSQYFPWAEAAGLSASQQDTDADSDGDGLTNFGEYAHGLDPTVPDAFRTGTDTFPGLPEVVVFTDTRGSRFLEVHYWRRSQLTASIETAIDPTGTALLGHADGWATAANPPTSFNHPDGWVRHVWRSATPITAGTQQFARVRTSMP